MGITIKYAFVTIFISIYYYYYFTVIISACHHAIIILAWCILSESFLPLHTLWTTISLRPHRCLLQRRQKWIRGALKHFWSLGATAIEYLVPLIYSAMYIMYSLYNTSKHWHLPWLVVVTSQATQGSCDDTRNTATCSMLSAFIWCLW